jgi:hypothetical protein
MMQPVDLFARQDSVPATDQIQFIRYIDGHTEPEVLHTVEGRLQGPSRRDRRGEPPWAVRSRSARCGGFPGITQWRLADCSSVPRRFEALKRAAGRHGERNSFGPPEMFAAGAARIVSARYQQALVGPTKEFL